MVRITYLSTDQSNCYHMKWTTHFCRTKVSDITGYRTWSRNFPSVVKFQVFMPISFHKYYQCRVVQSKMRQILRSWHRNKQKTDVNVFSCVNIAGWFSSWRTRSAGPHSFKWHEWTLAMALQLMMVRPIIIISSSSSCRSVIIIRLFVIINVKKLNSLKQCLTATRPTSHN